MPVGAATTTDVFLNPCCCEVLVVMRWQCGDREDCTATPHRRILAWAGGDVPTHEDGDY